MVTTTTPTVRTHAIPRPWLPSTPLPPQPDPEDATLLAQLAELCAESYAATAESFATGVGFNDISERQAFGRGKGDWPWRPVAILLMPFNYLVIAWMSAMPMVLLVIIAALTEAVGRSLTGRPWHFLAGLLVKLPYALQLLSEVAFGAGLVVGVAIALAPRLASGRAFGVVDAGRQRAIVVFCGSKPYDNFTINSLVGPYLSPLRHLGFHRAWIHLRPAVRPWLEGLIKEKKVKEIVFTGHSLGGALAQIAALDLASQFAIGQVVSLGSACIGGPGMRDRFAQCRVADGEGVLHERTRVFAYTKDIMPRIPPISWFCHVGRRFCLPEAGRPIEGSEASLWAGLIALFRRSISGLAFFVLDLATIIRDSSRGRRKRSQINSLHLTKRDAKPELQGDLVVASSHDFDLRGAAEDKVTFGDLFRYAKQIWQCVPRKDHLVHHAIVAATVIAVLSPIVLLVTIYGYYVMMIWKGLFSGHGVGNYRYVLRQYYASVRPQPAAVASTPKSMEELVLLAGNVRWYQRWLAGETSSMVSDRQLIYVADGQPRHLFVTKFAEYHRWRRERAVPNLTREARDKIDARARSNGLNTDQVKAIWGDGKSLFVERLLNDELCMLPQPYSGSYAEAIGRLGLVLGPGYWSLVTPMSGSPAAGSA